MLLRLSLLAILAGFAPLMAAGFGAGLYATLACVNPPFAADPEGLCGVAETMRGFIWWATAGLPIAILGIFGVLAWIFSTFWRR